MTCQELITFFQEFNLTVKYDTLSHYLLRMKTSKPAYVYEFLKKYPDDNMGSPTIIYGVSDKFNKIMNV